MSDELSQEIQDAVNSMDFVDLDDNALQVKSMRKIESNRLKIYAAVLENVASAAIVVAVTCVAASDEEEQNEDENENKQENNANNNDENAELFEKIVAVSADNNCELIEYEDKITMEDLSPSDLIEYTFYADGEWYLAPMSKSSLEHYRKSKFENWKHMIENPVCEAAFKRLLSIGLITNMFDHLAFPSPDNEIADWQVKDDHGKTVLIPRPVHGLRNWNVNGKCYEAVTAHLEGAPDAKDADEYWNKMLAKFRAEQGAEYIDSLIQAFSKNDSTSATAATDDNSNSNNNTNNK